MGGGGAAGSRPATRVLLVDALNLIRRVYAAQPGEDGPERVEAGRAACGQSLERALRECSPTHAAAVFEGPGATWRHRLFAGYKAGHRPMPEALRAGLPAYEETFFRLGVRSLRLSGREADDVIATLAVKVEKAGGEAVILSTDKIFLQLLSRRVSVRDHFGRRDLDGSYVLRRFGVPPESFVDYLALAGDATNGVAGVAGVGPKTAAMLLADYDSLDGALAAAAAGEGGTALSPKLAARLRTQDAAARLARSLVGLKTDLELGIRLKSLRCAPRA